MDALDTRVALLEAILGMDETAVATCKGSPEDCGNKCTETTCPLRDNHLSRLSATLQHVRRDAVFLRCLTDELETLGVVPEGTLVRVEARAEVARLEGVLADVSRVRRQLEQLGARGTVLERAIERETKVVREVLEARELLTRINRTLH